MSKLIELTEGQTAIISMIEGDTRFLSRIIAIGLTVGGQVKVLRNEKKMPLLVYSRDSMIAINRGERKHHGGGAGMSIAAATKNPPVIALLGQPNSGKSTL